MRKRTREVVAASVIVGAATAAALGAAVFRGKQQVEGHAVAAGSPGTSTSQEHVSNFPVEMGYKTMVVAQNIHDLYYRAPEATEQSTRDGILHHAEFPLRNGVTTYFEQRSTSISNPETVNHITIGQSDPSDENQFEITFDKDENDEWTVTCTDEDNELKISDGVINSSNGEVSDPAQAEKAMLAIADKAEEIVGATMGDPTGNPVQDPVPSICEQFMPR